MSECVCVCVCVCACVRACVHACVKMRREEIIHRVFQPCNQVHEMLSNTILLNGKHIHFRGA